MAERPQPPRALVISGASWNRMVHLPHLPRGGSETIFATGAHEAVGSSGAGKTLNLRACGVEVVLWCRLGDDGPGAYGWLTGADVGACGRRGAERAAAAVASWDLA